MEKYITQPSNRYVKLEQDTGVIEVYKETKKVTIDEFIMIFFSSFPELFSLQGAQLKVLMCCWKYSTYNAEQVEDGNVVHNNSSFKAYCKQDGLETSDAHIDNAISSLCKRGLLIKRCRGEYLLNPEYFFKGKLSDRSKLQLNILVDPLKEIDEKEGEEEVGTNT